MRRRVSASSSVRWSVVAADHAAANPSTSPSGFGRAHAGRAMPVQSATTAQADVKSVACPWRTRKSNTEMDSLVRKL